MKTKNVKLVLLCMLLSSLTSFSTLSAQAPGKVQFSLHLSNPVQIDRDQGNYFYPYYYDDLFSSYYPYPAYDKISNQSFSLGTSVGMTLKNGLVARIRVDYDRNKIIASNNDSYEYADTRSESSSSLERTQHNMQFALGLQGFLGKGKFRLTGGANAIFRSYGKINQTDESYSEYDQSTVYYEYKNNQDRQTDGGYGLGMGISLGTQFQLSKHIYLGLSYNPSLLYQKVGGKVNVTGEYSSLTRHKDSNGQVTSEEIINEQNNYSQDREISGWKVDNKRISLTLMFAF